MSADVGTTAPPGRVRLLRVVDDRLLAPGSAHRLACVRTVLAATIAFRLAIGDWRDLAGRPSAVYDPVGIGHLMPGVPPVGVLVAIQVVGVVAALAAAFARAPAFSLPVGWLALLTLAALETSGGKILHNEVLVLLATVPILFAPGMARIGDRTRTAAYGWAPRASLAVVGLVYFLSGYQKLVHSGPVWVTGPTMAWVLYQGADAGLAPGLARWIAGTPLLPNLLAGGALTLELLAPVILAIRLTRPAYLLVALMMHATIGIFLGLDYSAWVLTVAAVVLPWDSLPIARRTRRTEATTPSDGSAA